MIFALAAGALAQAPPNTPGVSQPRLIKKQEPQDSDEARKARLEGRVGLSMLVSAEGAVQDVQVTKPAGLGLDENAMDAVRTWVFRPGMKDGQPVPVTTKVEVNFRHMVGPTEWRLERALLDTPAGASRPKVIDVDFPAPESRAVNASVVVSFDVDEHGEPASFHVENSSDSQWESGVIAAAKQWRFQPGMKDGAPIPVRATFNFVHPGS